MPTTRISTIDGDHQRHLGQLAADVEQLPQPLTRGRRVGDQLGGHQRAPGERPALPQTAEVARAARPAAARTGSGRAVDRPEHPADPVEQRRHLLHAAEQPVGDRRHRTQQDDGVDGGVRQLEPDDRRGHPGDRRQALQPADDRADRGPQPAAPPHGQPEQRADDQRHREPDGARGSGWSRPPRARVPSCTVCQNVAATSAGDGQRVGRLELGDVGQLPDADQQRRGTRSAAAPSGRTSGRAPAPAGRSGALSSASSPASTVRLLGGGVRATSGRARRPSRSVTGHGG